MRKREEQMNNNKLDSVVEEPKEALVPCVFGPECISEHLHFYMTSLGCDIVPSDVHKVAGFVYKRADALAKVAEERHAGLIPCMVLCITAPGCQAENVSVSVNTAICNLVVTIHRPDKSFNRVNTILDVCASNVFNTNLQKVGDKESLLEQLDITITIPWTYDLTEVTASVKHGLIIVVVPCRYAVREYACKVSNDSDILDQFHATLEDMQRICSGDK